MTQVTICDNCKQIIIEPTKHKTIKLCTKETDLKYNSSHRSSSDSGFTFNYNFDICLDCFKKLIQNF